MPKLPKLNFPAVQLRGRRTAQGCEVWDSLRGQWVVLTPEEWVRRHLAAYLVEACGCEPQQLVEEYPVPLNGQAQRAGTRFASTDEDYDEESGRLTMQLRDAYPAEAAIKSYVRSAVLMDGCVTLTDELLLEGEGEVDFHFLTTADPTDCEKGAFTLFGCRITYDPALSMRVEKIEKEAPETAVIPAHWETDAIRRITLTGKVPVEGKTFVITVKKKR